MLTWNEDLMAADDHGKIGYWLPGLLPVAPRGGTSASPTPATADEHVFDVSLGQAYALRAERRRDGVELQRLRTRRWWRSSTDGPRGVA